MAQIHLLNQDTINKIAAGEVIERPMAVVKELIENAIDAKATAVTVEIQDGGKGLIRITDNGSGIASEDIALAFAPHATSKIQDVTDLLKISSLGFRGEALSSIAAVSQLEMVTKTKEELMGVRYCMDGGEKKAEESVGCPDGTTFLVRNLFYNTPARLKFLKTAQTEAGYVSSLVERMALSHPAISFRFINQKQTKLSTSGNGNLKDVIYQIYGREIAANLIETSQKEVFCRLSGFIGKPVISRGNRNMMNYFINGRYIKSQIIQKAIEEAYAPYSMQHRYPFTVLHIMVDSQYIDVNVHPQKMEIRFNKEKEIFQSIYHGVSEALKHREFIPDVTFQTKKEGTKKKITPIEPFEQKRQAEYQKSREDSSKPQFPVKATESLQSLQNQTKDSDSSERLQNQTKITKHLGKIQNNGKSVKQQEAENFPNSHRQDNIKILEELTKEEPCADHVAEHAEYPASTSVSETDFTRNKPVKNEKQETLFEEEFLSEKVQKEVKIIGQVFSTYWILQYENTMYLVDQHAAHEKVLFERFMNEIRKKKPMTQLLQPPIILPLSMIQCQAVEEHLEIFEQLGYQIEPFGGREYAVSGVPAHLPSIGTKDLLIEVIDTLTEEQGRTREPAILLDKVASMSCKAAVKGNQKLPPEQMQELLKELMTLENPYHCPHGRPTMIRMTKTELEKRFKRIV